MPHKLLKRILTSLAAGYLSLIAIFCFVQRDLIYHPAQDGKETPALYNTPFNEIRIKNSSSTSMQAWWIPQADQQKTRALLYCHGNSATLSRLADVASIFHQLGVSALIFDYRNFGRSDRSNEGLNQKALVSDAQAGYDWIKAQGFSEDRILIWGHSLGAAVAAHVAAQNTPQALVLEGPFSSIPAMGRARYPWLLMPEFLIWDKFDNLAAVHKIKARVLVMHAENDTIIPISMGREVFEHANQPKQFVLLKGIDHNDFPSVYKQYKEMLVQFFEG